MATTISYGILLPTVGGDTDLWGGYLNTSLTLIAGELATKTANVNFADYTLSRPVLKDYAETKYDLAYASSITIDLTNGNHQKTTLTGNITSVTINNPAPTGNACILRWIVKQDATGGRTITFPASFKFVGGVSPSLDTTASTTSVITAITYDAGTTWEVSTTTGYVGL